MTLEQNQLLMRLLIRAFMEKSLISYTFFLYLFDCEIL